MEPVTAWADEQLAAQGVARTGEIGLNRARPWSTTWCTTTELGVVWIKACGPGSRYEAALSALLATVAPEWSLQPLAVDIDRGWLLLPDGGPTLASVLAGSPPDMVAGLWTSMLAEYAGLQRRMIEFVPHLLAVDVPDLRPAAAPALFDRLVSAHTTDPLRQRLLDSGSRFAEVCDRLAASAVPATLQHDDLHAGAAFCGADGLGAPAFFDWGDTMVSHPFASLLVCRQVLVQTLGAEEGGAAVERATDAYLGQWSDVAPAADLHTELPDVLQLGRLGRAWSWARALTDAGPEQVREWDDPVAWWLRQLL